MALDHGLLNLPLAKRGNIDAQLDAYKAKQAATAAIARKAAAESTRTAKAAAKVALAAMIAEPGLIAAKAARINTTPRNLVRILTAWATWEPTKLLNAHADWMPAAKVGGVA